MRHFLMFICLALLGTSAQATVTFDEQTIQLTGPSTFHSLRVQIAKNDEQRKQGLMHRESMAPYEGMLFEFMSEQIISMWMKDTPMSLDMVFFDNQRKIVRIVERATPFSLDTISSEKPARYVLELAAGGVQQLSLQLGDQFSYATH